MRFEPMKQFVLQYLTGCLVMNGSSIACKVLILNLPKRESICFVPHSKKWGYNEAAAHLPFPRSSRRRRMRPASVRVVVWGRHPQAGRMRKVRGRRGRNRLGVPPRSATLLAVTRGYCWPLIAECKNKSYFNISTFQHQQKASFHYPQKSFSNFSPKKNERAFYFYNRITEAIK